ncbi:hypothetical protein FGO68_gene2122 [Halteria grandinella]|uniref:Uncharacterized protein n=1 Tax=Halteria grandinella TaxID=5974 RepID=A0A8J8NPB5_HALGN|nr:hypothetical protein FGO68_gene2122 [Halteria grandinella]
MADVLSSQKNCLQMRCLKEQSASPHEFMNCVKNCETGVQEVIKMQQKHVEVGRLTYTKNIQRCLSIHGGPSNDEDVESDYNPTSLAHCISHNTDKVDRRFFGYYNNQKIKLSQKYQFP